MRRAYYGSMPIEVADSNKISTGAKLVFFRLCAACGWPNKLKPSYWTEKDLAKTLNVSLSSVQRYKKELLNAGLISWPDPVGGRCYISITTSDEDGVEGTSNLNRGVGHKGAYEEAKMAEEDNAEKKDEHVDLKEGTSKSDVPPIHYINTKRNTIRETPEGASHIRSNMQDSMARSSEYKKRNPINDAKRHTDRHAERVSAKAARSASTWRGAGFLVHMNALCDVHGIEPSATLKGPALTRNMNLIIKEYEDRGIDRVKLADIMRWVIESWTDNLEVRLTSARYPDLSIFTFKWHIKSIIRLYTNSRIRTTPLKSEPSSQLTDADLAQF